MGNDIEKGKICPSCNVVYDVTMFGPCKTRRDGLAAYCRPCSRSALRNWRNRNIESCRRKERDYANRHSDKRAVRAKAWVLKNPDRYQETGRRYRKENSDHLREVNRRWKAANRNRVTEHNRFRECVQKQAAPSWLTREHRKQMAAMYWLARICAEGTGEPHHVDHIVPLVSPVVCGLHVPWNLQVLTARENLAKKNKHTP